METKTKYSCEVLAIHEDMVNKAKETMPKAEELVRLSDLFRIIGDQTRCKILWLLQKNELCVCDISVILQMTQSAISHQLKVLKEANLVKNRRDGKVIYYSLKDEHVADIFNIATVHVNEDIH